MKTARDLYPNTDDKVFEKASKWMGETYSYVPYMEPARNGFIAGYESVKPIMQSEALLNTSLSRKNIELAERIVLAEKAMANAYAWPNDGDVRTEHVKECLRKYRTKYPEVYLPTESLRTIS